MEIRNATSEDFAKIGEVIRLAFEGMAESDHREQLLVDRLRQGKTYIPELDLAAVVDGNIVGHICMTRITVGGHDAVALAPLAVLPSFQRQGIGSNLIKTAHEKAVEIGYGVSVLLGHPAYYHRFGYRPASEYRIEFPFDVPDECCMVAELIPGALAAVSGPVQYPDAFFE